MAKQYVKITVTMDCGHKLEFVDTIEDKYPFYCDECELDHRTGRYPWKLSTKIVTEQAEQAEGLVFSDEVLAGRVGELEQRVGRLEANLFDGSVS